LCVGWLGCLLRVRSMCECLADVVWSWCAVVWRVGQLDGITLKKNRRAVARAWRRTAPTPPTAHNATTRAPPPTHLRQFALSPTTPATITTAHHARSCANHRRPQHSPRSRAAPPPHHRQPQHRVSTRRAHSPSTPARVPLTPPATTTTAIHARSFPTRHQPRLSLPLPATPPLHHQLLSTEMIAVRVRHHAASPLRRVYGRI